MRTAQTRLGSSVTTSLACSYRVAMTRGSNSRPLVGAYGLFWDRHEIEWDAGRGTTYQMLGYRGDRRPRLEVCDFRRARGTYVLYNDYGPTYVGRARGNQGFGNRLSAHHRDKSKRWVRFSWFAFDSVENWPEHDCWRRPAANDASNSVDSQSAIDGVEALMIVAFGLSGQNQMKLGGGVPWKQLTYQDCGPGGIGRRVAAAPIRTPTLREALAFQWE